MGIKTINLDMESEGILNKLRDKDPNFNLSGFIQQSLMNFDGATNLDLAEINKRKGMIQIKMKELEQDLKYWDDKILEYMMYQEKLKKEELERQRLEEIKNDKEKQRQKIVKDTFEEEVGRAMTEGEYDAYMSGVAAQKYRSLWAYIDEVKGELNGGAAPDASNSQKQEGLKDE